MTTIRDLLDVIEKIAPPDLALPGDPIGMQIGLESAPLNKAIVALDPSVGLFEYAASQNAQAVILHHPLYYNINPILQGEEPKAKIARIAIKNNIAVIGAHTNWDTAIGGVNDTLVHLLGLQNPRNCGDEIKIPHSKVVTFVPTKHVNAVINSLSAAGCGVIGNYERCAFTSSGEGTFLGNDESNPTIGNKGQIESVIETKVEMIVPDTKLASALSALKESHPYEEPAYDIYPVKNEYRASLSRMADTKVPTAASDFASHIERVLQTKVRLYGNPNQMLSKIGIIGGAAGDMWRGIQKAGCDALVTGEVRQHDALEASNIGFVSFEAGHFHTENPGMKALAERLNKEMDSVQFVHWEPNPGEYGRPA